MVGRGSQLTTNCNMGKIMTIDTLGYTKHLEGAGIDRPTAEAQAEAMSRFVVPQLATKADLDKLETSLTLRVLGIGAALNGVLFALLKFTA